MRNLRIGVKLFLNPIRNAAPQLTRQSFDHPLSIVKRKIAD